MILALFSVQENVNTCSNNPVFLSILNPSACIVRVEEEEVHGFPMADYLRAAASFDMSFVHNWSEVWQEDDHPQTTRAPSTGDNAGTYLSDFQPQTTRRQSSAI